MDVNGTKPLTLINCVDQSSHSRARSSQRSRLRPVSGMQPMPPLLSSLDDAGGQEEGNTKEERQKRSCLPRYRRNWLQRLALDGVAHGDLRSSEGRFGWGPLAMSSQMRATSATMGLVASSAARVTHRGAWQAGLPDGFNRFVAIKSHALKELSFLCLSSQTKADGQALAPQPRG